MPWIDTHSHLFSDEFKPDIGDVMQRIQTAGISKVILPNIDVPGFDDMVVLSSIYPDVCLPTIGLHPSYVKEDFHEQLEVLNGRRNMHTFYAIGETGIDLYWDKSTLDWQIESLDIQLEWASKMNLPVILHTRESFSITLERVMAAKGKNPSLKGVFHCFTGTWEEAKQVESIGFFMGIGGVLTFKNSKLPEVLKRVSKDHIVLETDSPYLSPVPFRGKRNESTYLPLVGEALAAVWGQPVEEVMNITSGNASRLFQLDGFSDISPKD